MSRIWDKSKPPTGPFTLDRDNPIAKGLVAWYPTTGVSAGNYLADRLDKRHLASVVSATQTSNVETDGGASIKFGGTGSLVSTLGANLIPTQELSISAWVNPANTGAGGVACLGQFSSGANRFQFDITAGAARWIARSSSTAIASVSGVVANKLQHVIGTEISPTSRKVYLNGGTPGTDTTSSGLTIASLDTIQVGGINLSSGYSGPFAGSIADVCIWSVALTAQQVTYVASPANRFALYYPLRSRKWISLASGSSGSVSSTNTNDTLAASGNTTIIGSLANTNINDSISASGSVGSAVSGTINYTNINDSLNSSGTTTIVGTVNQTNSNDSISASGSPIVSGTVNKTNGNDVLAGNGSPIIVGSLAKTNNNDTISANGSVGNAVAGTVNYANINDLLSTSGTTAVLGTLAKTNINDTGLANGFTTILGSLNRTNNNDSLNANGSVGGGSVSGSLASTNLNDTLSSFGFTTITGVLVKTNSNDLVNSAGFTTILASLAKTNNNDTVSASGFTGSGLITGTVNYTNHNDILISSSIRSYIKFVFEPRGTNFDFPMR